MTGMGNCHIGGYLFLQVLILTLTWGFSRTHVQATSVTNHLSLQDPYLDRLLRINCCLAFSYWHSLQRVQQRPLTEVASFPTDFPNLVKEKFDIRCPSKQRLVFTQSLL